MIISRTPFRVSLAGGGSDLAAYYRRQPGHVVALAIDRYMYVTVNRRFDDSIRVSYTRTEIVDHLDDLEHDLIREALRMTGVVRGVEVTTVADLPAGIGLGSSSALAVGVLNALYALKGEWRSPGELARRACEIEIDVLGRPIGKQDQYIAAFGGLQDLRFEPDGSVQVRPVVCASSVPRRLTRRLLLYFTGQQRNAADILEPVQAGLRRSGGCRPNVDRLVALAGRTRESLVAGRVDALGPLLHESWLAKRRTAPGVTTPRLDRLYRRARRAGADGGKVAGAGGGGCFLLFTRPGARKAVQQSMTRAGLKEVAFALEPEGSRIVHYGP